jgi:SAM-dependent methyltransferase
MAEKHFHEQRHYAQTYLVPFLEKRLGALHGKALEVGCAEAGLLDVLNQKGIYTVGVELDPGRVRLAMSLRPHLEVFVGDITDPHLPNRLGETFDLIVMREVIEHVPDRIAVFHNLSKLLNDQGYLYIPFPPRFSPFAGHQQVGRSRLRFFPYLHFLPEMILRPLGRLCKENEAVINNALENYRLGLTVTAFERFVRNSGLVFIIKNLFLFRPIYQQRFGIKPLRFPNWPIARELFATGCECLLQKNMRYNKKAPHDMVGA